MSCGEQIEFWLQVRNNGFTYVLNQPQVDWRPTVTLIGDVGGDGVVLAESDGASLRGTIDQGHLTGKLVGNACTWTIEADRAGTW